MIFRFISRFFKLIIMVILIAGIAYLGACIYANFIQREPGEYKLPSIDKARYELTIQNTGKVLFTDIYETSGSEIVLQGYWELTDNKFRYRDRQITLDQSIFGIISIRSR